ncbi:MAG: lipoyl(octanoyl) transferase LipB, partial [Chloroflexota bacterium]|nr:lipoyl(octanoyl) transferase LipB [Chloroflexota bacterium]
MNERTAKTEGRAAWLGAGVLYDEAWTLQKRLAAFRSEERIPDTLLLLEHAPVYTAGRRAVAEHVIGALRAPLVETDRGGQTTYHGPGQLVGYPIISLREHGLGPRSYVDALEGAVIAALARFGVRAWCEPGLTAVWTAHGKIAAFGVKVSRGVTLHGFALNVSTDLAYYAPIIPCGIADRPVASAASILGEAPSMTAMRSAVTQELGTRLGIAWREVPQA